MTAGERRIGCDGPFLGRHNLVRLRHDADVEPRLLAHLVWLSTASWYARKRADRQSKNYHGFRAKAVAIRAAA